MSETPSGSANKTAPYTSFKSLKTLIASLKEHGIPNRIDRSVLTSFSGVVGTQIMTALRFLELTEDGGHPTESMKRLVEAYGSDDWGGELERVLRSTYEPLFAMDLKTASPKEFADVFRNSYSGTEDVRRKSETFFLNAVRDTRIEVSAYILKKQRPRTSGAARASRKTPRKPASQKTDSNMSGHEAENDGAWAASPYAMLIEILNTEEMSDDEQEAVFTLIRFLKRRDAS